MSDTDGIHGYCASCRFYSRDGERAWWGRCLKRLPPPGWDPIFNPMEDHLNTTDGDRCDKWEVGETQMKEAMERARSALFVEMGDYNND